MMTLETHGPDTFIGVGPHYPWGGLYGGQIVAQGLRAAAHRPSTTRTTCTRCTLTSSGGATTPSPIRFEVERLRNGRSFVTRSVVARQGVGAILQMSASFQRDEPGPIVERAEAPAVARPDDIASGSLVADVRQPQGHRRAERGHITTWFKMTDPIGDDPLLQACALAFVSDDVPTETVVSSTPTTATRTSPRTTRGWPPASTMPSGSTARRGWTTGC